MQTTKKKPSLIFILVGAVLAGYLGYLINGAWSEGVAFNEFMNRFNEVCAAPFANYYNTNTIKAVAIALGIDCTPDSLDSRLKRLPADKQDYLKKTFDFMIEQALKSA